ncbi:MAG: glycosyltransferase [Desulfobacterales bacterium]|nr:glycosyltransferase [Desulfobacterales bacterium]
MKKEVKKFIAGKVILVAKPWKGGLSNYFFRALQDLSEHVKWFFTYPVGLKDKLDYRKNKKKWGMRLAEEIASTEYDIAIFINTIKEFSALDHSDKHVIWITDDPRLVLGQLEPFGRVYLADPGYRDEVVPHLKKQKFGGILPFAHLPEIHKPFKAVNTQHDVCFIGNQDPKRDIYLKALLSSRIDFKVYGNYFLKSSLYWLHPRSFSPPVSNYVMGKIYSQYSISLNIHAQVVREGTNMRTFECAGYGITQVVEFRSGLSEYFEPDKEIIFFRSPREMIEKIEALRKNKVLSHNLAKMARKRVLSDHTYQHRAKTIIEGL